MEEEEEEEVVVDVVNATTTDVELGGSITTSRRVAIAFAIIDFIFYITSLLPFFLVALSCWKRLGLDRGLWKDL